MRTRLGILLLLVLMLAGCTYSVKRTGDPSFLLGEIEWRIGHTTTAEVAQKLGPPDDIRIWGSKLWFLYAFNYESTSGLKLSYYVTWFTRRTVDRIDRTLLVAFDENDKLLYHATSPEAFDRNFADF